MSWQNQREEALRARAGDRAALHDAQFCPDCGYRWSLHDNSVPGRKLPWGCPSEAEAVRGWGR